MARQFQDGEFSCVATRCWHATLRDLRGPRLWDRFGSFARRFNDHPSEDNTHVYLAFHGDADQSPPAWDLSWCCRHVEHTFRDDLARLVEFLDELAPLLEDPQHPAIRLELLRDPHLHVRLFRPAEDVRGEVLRHARELDEWRPEPDAPAAGDVRPWCDKVAMLAVDELVSAGIVKREAFERAVGIVSQEVFARLAMGDCPPAPPPGAS